MATEVLLVTDNIFLYKKFKTIVEKSKYEDIVFTYCCTDKVINAQNRELLTIDINNDYSKLAEKYALIISLHCKRIFPSKLVKETRCINIHPGLNPYNRGWFPQVFSILNNLPLGVTIHEMDEQIDHGPIIVQKEIQTYPWDTSLSLYNRILDLELELIENNLINLINKNYQTFLPSSEGNFNSKKDFDKLIKLDLNETGTAKYFIDRFRALTHGEYKNLYFIEEASSKKVFIKIELTPESDS